MYGPTTQLNAVNTMLSTIGEAPIASLTGTIPIDASMAVNVLDEVTKDFQTEGWYFNTDKHVTLALASDGTIPLPANTAMVEIDKQYNYETIQPVLRWNETTGMPYLYDVRNQSNTFTNTVIARRLVKWLDWNELPESARRYIIIRASRIFGDRMVGAESTHNYTAQDEARAFSKFKADDGEAAELNILSSQSTAQILNRQNFGTLIN